MGKAPIGVAHIAKKYDKPVIAFAGCVTPDANVCNEHGINAFFSILQGVVRLKEAIVLIVYGITGVIPFRPNPVNQPALPTDAGTPMTSGMISTSTSSNIFPICF